MSQRHLKSLVEAGHYKPDPELVAEAMLQRRGFRTFISGSSAGVSEADRTPAPRASDHQAA
jgi:hypothetical protein